MRVKHSALTVQKKETGLVTEKVQEVFAEQVYESGSSLPRIQSLLHARSCAKCFMCVAKCVSIQVPRGPFYLVGGHLPQLLWRTATSGSYFSTFFAELEPPCPGVIKSYVCLLRDGSKPMADCVGSTKAPFPSLKMGRLRLQSSHGIRLRLDIAGDHVLPLLLPYSASLAPTGSS